MNNLMGNLGVLVTKNQEIIDALNRPLRTVAAMQGGPIHLTLGGLAAMASINRDRTGPLAYRLGGAVPTPMVVMRQAGMAALTKLDAMTLPRYAAGGAVLPRSLQDPHKSAGGAGRAGAMAYAMGGMVRLTNMPNIRKWLRSRPWQLPAVRHGRSGPREA